MSSKEENKILEFLFKITHDANIFEIESDKDLSVKG